MKTCSIPGWNAVWVGIVNILKRNGWCPHPSHGQMMILDDFHKKIQIMTTYWITTPYNILITELFYQWWEVGVDFFHPHQYGDPTRFVAGI